MSSLPVVHAATMEKLLLRLGFESVRQRGSQRSIDTPTDAHPRCLTTVDVTLQDRSSERSCGRSTSIHGSTGMH
jgi:predicted RNA binding protein YcfA (HicA-like mRNA interferase family)